MKESLDEKYDVVIQVDKSQISKLGDHVESGEEVESMIFNGREIEVKAHGSDGRHGFVAGDFVES